MNTDIAASWANLGLLRRPAAAFFVAVGGALASLGLFNCLEDGRARDAEVGTVHTAACLPPPLVRGRPLIL